MSTLVDFIKERKNIGLNFILRNAEFTKEIQSISLKFDLEYKEIIYRIKKDISFDKQFFCPTCGKKIKFKGLYHTFCSKKCSSQNFNTRQKCKQTWLKKYGTDNPSKNAIIKNKILQALNNKTAAEKKQIILKSKQTRLEKYGDENYTNREKKEKTCIERYGTSHPNNVEKAKQTCLSNIDENNLNTYQRAALKVKQTCLEKYNNPNYKNEEKRKQTCLEKYGVINPAQSEVIKNKISQKNKNKTKAEKEQIILKTKKTKLERYGNANYTNQEKREKTNLLKYGDKCALLNENVIQKSKDTLINKYGVDNYSKTKNFKEKISLLKEQIQDKTYKTKKQNDSFNNTEPEKQAYQLCIEKFGDIATEYKSEKYPFKCDIYIPSKDIYIELNFHWTHGKEPFDKNNIEHQKLLEKWKSKNTKFYKTAFEVWSKKDIEKVKVAKQNRLNYFVFYKIEELVDWLEKYK